MARKKANLGGRPPAPESYQQVTLCLYDRQVLFLDKVALRIQEQTGKHINRAELVRALIDKASGSLEIDQPSPGLTKALKSRFPGVKIR